MSRAEAGDRVHRRARHEDETDEQGRRRRRQQHPGQGALWSEGDLDLDAGTYDDHGRTSHRDDDEPPMHRHVDAVA